MRTTFIIISTRWVWVLCSLNTLSFLFLVLYSMDSQRGLLPWLSWMLIQTSISWWKSSTLPASLHPHFLQEFSLSSLGLRSSIAFASSGLPAFFTPIFQKLFTPGKFLFSFTASSWFFLKTSQCFWAQISKFIVSLNIIECQLYRNDHNVISSIPINA